MYNLSWNEIINAMIDTEPKGNGTPRFNINDNEEILCKTEEDANCIADFLENLGFDTIHTSYNADAFEYRWEVYPD